MASVKYDTILSNFEGKLTLMQWLKACDASLKTLTEDFGELREDVDGLRHDLGQTQEFSNSLNQRLTAVEDRAIFLEGETDDLRGITTNLDTRVTALESAPAGGTSLYLHQITCQSPAFAMQIVTATSDQIQTGLHLSNAHAKLVSVISLSVSNTPLAFVNWQLNPISQGSVLQGLSEGGSTLTTASVSTASVITDVVKAL